MINGSTRMIDCLTYIRAELVGEGVVGDAGLEGSPAESTPSLL